MATYRIRMKSNADQFHAQIDPEDQGRWGFFDDFGITVAAENCEDLKLVLTRNIVSIYKEKGNSREASVQFDVETDKDEIRLRLWKGKNGYLEISSLRQEEDQWTSIDTQHVPEGVDRDSPQTSILTLNPEK